MSENQQTSTADNSTLSDEFNVMLKDFVDFALVMGRAAGKAAEDLTGLMVVKVGAGEREDLDIMVNAGLAKTRAEAALKLMADRFHVFENGPVADLLGQKSPVAGDI